MRARQHELVISIRYYCGQGPRLEQEIQRSSGVDEAYNDTYPSWLVMPSPSAFFSSLNTKARGPGRERKHFNLISFALWGVPKRRTELAEVVFFNCGKPIPAYYLLLSLIASLSHIIAILWRSRFPPIHCILLLVEIKLYMFNKNHPCALIRFRISMPGEHLSTMPPTHVCLQGFKIALTFAWRLRLFCASRSSCPGEADPPHCPTQLLHLSIQGPRSDVHCCPYLSTCFCCQCFATYRHWLGIFSV